jgi:predicted DNA binding CopG/RHH family protein
VKPKKIELTKTTLRIPKHLLDGCKHLAIDEGVNLQDVIGDALEAYLKTKTKSGKGKR